MTDPLVKMIRRPITVAGGDRKWEVTTIVTSPGDLPFTELFVITIVDPGDPKTDIFARVVEPFEFRFEVQDGPIYVKVDSADLITLNSDPFARIASPSELTAMPRDRVLAVRQNRSEFLSSAITLVYDSLDTATAAYKQLLDRLSSLVEAWATANTDFITHPYQVYTLPVVSATIEAERIAAWQAARDARVDAEGTRDTAVAASGQCEQECLYKRQRYQDLTEDVTFLRHARDLVTVMTETGTTNAKNFVLNGSDASSYETLLSRKLGQLTTALAAVQACDTHCADLRQAAIEAQAAVDAAQRPERAALTALLAICPTYDTSAS